MAVSVSILSIFYLIIAQSRFLCNLQTPQIVRHFAEKAKKRPVGVAVYKTEQKHGSCQTGIADKRERIAGISIPCFCPCRSTGGFTARFRVLSSGGLSAQGDGTVRHRGRSRQDLQRYGGEDVPRRGHSQWPLIITPEKVIVSPPSADSRKERSAQWAGAEMYQLINFIVTCPNWRTSL